MKHIASISFVTLLLLSLAFVSIDFFIDSELNPEPIDDISNFSYERKEICQIDTIQNLMTDVLEPMISAYYEDSLVRLTYTNETRLIEVVFYQCFNNNNNSKFKKSGYIELWKDQRNPLEDSSFIYVQSGIELVQLKLNGKTLLAYIPEKPSKAHYFFGILGGLIIVGLLYNLFLVLRKTNSELTFEITKSFTLDDYQILQSKLNKHGKQWIPTIFISIICFAVIVVIPSEYLGKVSLLRGHISTNLSSNSLLETFGYSILLFLPLYFVLMIFLKWVLVDKPLINDLNTEKKYQVQVRINKIKYNTKGNLWLLTTNSPFNLFKTIALENDDYLKWKSIIKEKNIVWVEKTIYSEIILNMYI